MNAVIFSDVLKVWVSHLASSEKFSARKMSSSKQRAYSKLRSEIEHWTYFRKMNRQTSIVTSRCGVTGDEDVTTDGKIPTERRVLLPNPTGDGDLGTRSFVGVETTEQDKIQKTLFPEADEHPVLVPDECGFYLKISHGFRIDFVANGGVRIYNSDTKSAIYFSDNGDEVCVITPYGRVHRFNDVVTGLISDKIAKMSSRGVTFTAQGKPIVYLIDAAGCKSTTDKFKYLSGDITSQVLLRRRDVGSKGRERIQQLMKSVRKEFQEDIQQEVWYISDFIFTLTTSGRLMVRKPDFRFFAVIDPDGSVKVKIDRYTFIFRQRLVSFVKFSATVTSDADKEVEQSVKIEHSRLIAKCASQRAVLDQNNVLVLSSS